MDMWIIKSFKKYRKVITIKVRIGVTFGERGLCWDTWRGYWGGWQVLFISLWFYC